MKIRSITFLFACIAAVILMTSSTAVKAQSMNENFYLGKAHSADGLPKLLAQYKGYEVNASVEVYASCFVQGFLTRVVYSARPAYSGNPEDGYAPAMPIVIAVVEFDCDNNISSVTY